MSKSFNKFKLKVRVQAIASAVLWGLAVGLAASAVLMLVYKLLGEAAPTLYYLISAGGALLLSLATYFILMPSDVRLAKRLDLLYSLDEKVATMVELRDDDGMFAELQREDADVRLGEKPIKQFKSRAIVAGIVALAIAIGMFAGAMLVPPKQDPPETPIDEFDKQWIITAINELITIIENAYIDDGLRGDVLEDLRSLLAFVEGSQLLSEMKAEAVKAVISINESLKAANSAEAIGEQLQGSADTAISELGKSMVALSGSASKKALEALGYEISEGNSSDAAFVADELNGYLQRSGARSDNELYLLFKGLIAEVKSNPSGADAKFETAAKTLSSMVIIQNVNKATVNTVIKTLCNIFGITSDDITAVDPDTDINVGDLTDRDEITDDTEVDEPEGEMGSGGLGTGEIIYGSNDLVFDPDTNTYRPYGEILNDYFAKVNEQILDGKTSNDITDAIEDYFDALFGKGNND